MRTKNIRLGFEVEMDKNSKALPLYFKPWSQNKDFKAAGHSPLPYMSDALTALSFYKVLSWLYPDYKPEVAPEGFDFATCWKELDPGAALYDSATPRIKALKKHLHQWPKETTHKFEKLLWGSFQAAFSPEGVDLKVLSDTLNSIQYFEEEMKHPLIFNFSFSFSPEMRDLLQAVESFLFNLRSVIASDLNAHVRDTAHEAFVVDPIKDYLPKADYVVADAMLYHQFRKVTGPFVMGQKSDVRLEKLLIEPLNKAFFQYTQNACYLVNGLPPEFLNQLSPSEMEEALYMVQMDWLLGTDSGLLFKVREELFGLENSYERVFWPELRDKSYLKPARLQINVELPLEMIFGQKSA